MTRRASWILTIVTCVLAGGAPLRAQARAELSGRWVLDRAVTPTLESVVPAWEEVVADAAVVSIRRATRAQAVETYLADDLEREVARRVEQPRTCRTTWEEARLVITCRERHAVPGGTVAIGTREVRYLDAEGRLIVERTWRSGDRVHTDRRVYRRDVQP
jgi:hypothetical protein